MKTSTSSNTSKLVDAEGLLNALFDEASRPSVRWVREQQAQRSIPYVRCGRLVRFDVDEVRKALFRNTVSPKWAR